MADIGLDEVADSGLRIQLLGPFQLFAGLSTTALPLPAGKATTLAQLLAVRRGTFVSIDTVIEVLWEDDAPPAAAQNVASLVSRLRRVLGPERITGGRGGYRLDLGGCVVDIDIAERLVREADAQLRARRPALAASAATQARAILERGVFLEDQPFATWAEEGRRQAERLVRQARRAAWSAALAFGEYAAARDAATQAIEANALDEEAHRARVEALYRSGDAASALASYEALRKAIVEDLGADPSPQSEALYLAILRSEPVPFVDGRAPAGPGAPQAGDLVGREDELQRLRERWAQAAPGLRRLSLSSAQRAPGRPACVPRWHGRRA